ncbi:MAG: hypothetical protein IJW55_06755 [Clostridia bacterium]|nr:hypothetical protein [Clostridia bacterium]
MKRLTSIFCMLLLVILLLTAVACNKEKPDTGNNESQTSPRDEETVEDNPNARADLPDGLNFDGATFTICSLVQEAASEEFSASLTGSLIDEAVFTRNDNLEYKFNCYIEVDETVGDTNTNTMYQKVEKLIQDGGADYHVFTTAGYKMTALAINGLLADITEMDAINLGKDYYSQGYNDALSFGESQYLVTGPMSMAYYRYMLVCLFNRTLFDQYGIDDPYAAVLDQQWTMEYVATLLEDFYSDLDGDGRDAEDLYGLYGWVGPYSSQMDGFMSACNLRVLAKDDSNTYKIDINADLFADNIDRCLRLLYNNGAYVSTDIGSNEAVMGKFASGEAGMMFYRLYVVETNDMVVLGKTGLGYGLLPIPKASETQKDYVSYVQDQCFLFGFSRTLINDSDKLQNMGLFFEAYASESYAVVRPAYYETALSSRYLGDPESVKMLDIISSNTFVDPVNVYFNTAFTFTTGDLREIWGSGENTIGSLIGGRLESGLLQQEVDALNDAYTKLLGQE